MSKQRMVRDSFWTDSYIEKLSPDEKLVFIYLLTNPLCNIAGLYEIRSKRIGFETGYDVEVIENILSRFERDGKIKRFNDWLKLVNFVKNQSLNPSVEAGIARVLSELPKDVREAFGLMELKTDIKKRSTENFTAIKAEESVCRKCGGDEKLQVDHVVPLFAGGDNQKENLQLLCHHCHQIKTQEDFTAYQNIGGTACATLLNSTLLNLTLPYAAAKKSPRKKSEVIVSDKLLFGEDKKVKLSQREYDQLVTDLGEIPTQTLIVELDQYIASRAKDPYSSHKAVIKTWYRRRVQDYADKNRPKPKSNAIATI